MRASRETLSGLRQGIAALGEGFASAPHGLFASGAPDFDEALSGGLARGALHEIYAGAPADTAAASGFAAALALRAAHDAPLAWVRQDAVDDETGRLHAPGLVEFGLHPDRLILIQVPDAAGVLRAGAEALRCGALGAVLLEAWGEPRLLDLTATRRLALAAGQTGVTPFLIRIAARPRPSAATTRWSVQAGASFALEANAPGFPVFKASLLRHRAGLAPRTWLVEWDRDRCAFSDAAPLSRRVAAAPPGGSVPAKPAILGGEGGSLRRAG
jgi:protein ImuA